MKLFQLKKKGKQEFQLNDFLITSHVTKVDKKTGMTDVVPVCSDGKIQWVSHKKAKKMWKPTCDCCGSELTTYEFVYDYAYDALDKFFPGFAGKAIPPFNMCLACFMNNFEKAYNNEEKQN